MEKNYNNPDCLEFWEELQSNVILDVSCSSWNENYAIKCFGSDNADKKIEGRIVKVRMSRGIKKNVSFDVCFPDKKYDKNYGGFDVNQIWKYAREIPPKYHGMRAAYIVEISKTAGMAMVEEDTSPEHLKDGNDDSSQFLPEQDETSEDEPSNVTDHRKRKGKSTTQGPQKVQRGKGDDQVVLSDVESEREIDLDGDHEEDELFFDPENLEPYFPSNEDQRADGTGKCAHMDDINDGEFVFNQEPFIEELPFTASPGPKHTLSPENAVPFDYFCLYIPIYFWSLWAQYTNAKAAMERGKSSKKGRLWEETTAAELKAWVAAIMVWCYFKTYSFEIFYCYAIKCW